MEQGRVLHCSRFMNVAKKSVVVADEAVVELAKLTSENVKKETESIKTEEKANEGEAVMADNVKEEKGFVVEVPDIPMPADGAAESEIINDECAVAFKLAFIGIGQGGGRLAESYWKLGYRRVCSINTNWQDMAAIKIPEANKLVMDIGHGGAGKDPAKGEQAAKQYREDIYDLMRRSFGREFDRIFILACAGGGTGGGGCLTVIDIAHEIAKSFKIETDIGAPAVGVVVSLPRVTEGGKVNANAYSLLESLFSRTGNGKTIAEGRTVSPLIIIDNDKINKIYPNLPVMKFWDTANQSFTSLFHLFNAIACQDSDFTTFDRADLKDIFEGGITTFGACPIKKWQTSTDISFAIRDNLRGNVLVGGFDFALAKAAGCVFIGSTDVLESIPQEYLEHGFEMLSRVMNPGSVMHRGIYRGNKPGLVVYSIVTELGKPEERMAEIAKAGCVGK